MKTASIERGHVLRTVQADWRWLTRDLHEKFDAVICLGNSFTHLFDEKDRRKALAEFYAVLRHDGVLILDQRNDDLILDQGYQTQHAYYYCGDQVAVKPVHIDEGLARFRYQFPDGALFHLNMCPLRKGYVRRLLQEASFQEILTFADFQETHHQPNPDFYIHVAAKLEAVMDGSFEDIPGDAAQYDVVWSQDAILHSGRRETVISEVVRVLKPGGLLIFTDPMAADDCPQAVLQPVLDRIHLDSLGSVAFYDAVTARWGMEPVHRALMTEQLVNHYSRVLQEVQCRYQSLQGVCSREYLDRMQKGLQHWIDAGNNGHLAWGILVYRKVV